jgi:hypothetical protein
MYQLSATLRLRPIRVGFLVDPTDMASLVQIMRISSCIWGGIYNPIIPVCKVLPEIWTRALPDLAPNSVQLAKGYIEFFEPDVYVQASPDLSVGLGISDAQIELGMQRISNLIDLLNGDPASDNPRVGLSMLGVYQELYDREFRFVPRHPPKVSTFKEGGTEDNAFVDCAFGSFPKEGQFAPLGRAYHQAFEPEEMEPTAISWLKMFEHRYRFPLSFTRHGIERAPSGYAPMEPTLFVIDPSSPCDLLDFWNMRLFRRDVLPINLNWFAETAPFIRDFITRNHRPLPGNPNNVMMHTTVEFGRSIGEERAKTAADRSLSGLPLGSWSFKLWYDRIWAIHHDEDHVVRPQRAQLTAGTLDRKLTVSNEGGEPSITFETAAPDFASNYGRGSWANVLRFSSFSQNVKWALDFPEDFNPEQARRFRLGGSVIPSREGIVLPQRFKGHGEYLRLLTGRDAMIAWLQQHGVKAVISSAGRVTEQVIESLDGLGGVQLIAHAETLKLLDKMAKSVRKYDDGKIEEYPDRTVAVQEWTGLIARRTQDPWSHNITLDRFVNANVLKLGLAIVCTHCRFENWFGIGGFGDSLLCDRCRKTYPFPQGSISFQNTPWRFRVVGPFTVPDYADGAYATALTLRLFSNTLSSGRPSVTYATGLEFSIPTGKPFEVDFSFWYRRENWRNGGETVAVFGEAKSFAEKCFTAKDVERMKRVALAFPGSFLVFATLKEALSDEEKALIIDFASWGRESLESGGPRAPVIVLTGIELFANWHVDHAWKQHEGMGKNFADAGHLHLDNLWTLADLTQQIYLGMQSRSDEMRRRWEAERAAALASGEQNL